MTEKMIEPKADAQGEKLDAIMSLLGKTIARLDEMEKELPAPPLVTAADKKAKKDEDDYSKHRKDDEEEEEEEAKKDDDKMSQSKAKKFMMRKVKKDDDEMCDDDEEDAKSRKDFEGSNPVEHGMAGEIKPDDEEDDRKDEDEEEAMKADEEEAAMCDAQAKADSVYAAFGKSASRPLKGENLLSYRKRMIRGLQAYSDEMKSVKISAIKDAAMLDIIEKRVFADALAASRGNGVAKGQLIAITRKDKAGREITEFRGDMEAWLGDFKIPSQRVMKFNTENFKR